MDHKIAKYKWSVLSLQLLLVSCISGSFVAEVPQEEGSIQSFFCDQTNCTSVFLNMTQHSERLHCAFYDANAKIEKQVLAKGALVVDENHPIAGAVVESGIGLMHDKFCVFNDTIWTGSWNPSQEMSIANNVVVFKSPTLAKAYEREFAELNSGIFHGGKSFPGRVILNGSKIEVFFCPEDLCKEHVLEKLKGAQKSIHFMTFSFTDDDIGNLLKEKQGEGLDVQGVFDPRMDKYSEYEKLKSVAKIVKTHHKVFIIDNETVITGSYNPTRNGNEKNDENVVIIDNSDLAAQFEKEWQRLSKT